MNERDLDEERMGGPESSGGPFSPSAPGEAPAPELPSPAARRAAAGPPAGAPVLSCEGIRKSYKIGSRQLEILHGVRMELFAGEVLGLMGASGAGKSTLLHILGLLDRPNEGRVWVQGQDGWKLPVPERAALRNRKIGFVFQFFHLLPELNAVENVMLPAMIANPARTSRARRREFRERAASLLESVGMADRMRHRPPQLSGGERQRVALARALYHDPPVLIADEPTGNLDRATGERVLELLFEAQTERNNALLIVTHDERLARRAGRVLYMEDGLILGDTSDAVPNA